MKDGFKNIYPYDLQLCIVRPFYLFVSGGLVANMSILITAESSSGHEEATRVYAGSAMVLALRWSELGYHDIRLTDKKGQSRTIQAFRQHLRDRRR